jgi:hypothetical protein
LLAALRGHGFHLEDTHLTKPERIENLLGLLALNTTWAFQPDSGPMSNSPFAKKTLQQPQFSFLRHGLDVLQRLAAQRETFAPPFLRLLGFPLDGQPLEPHSSMAWEMRLVWPYWNGFWCDLYCTDGLTSTRL